MAIWRAYIDDSGSDGAILFPDFTNRPIDPMDGTTKIKGMISPVTSLGIVAFHSSKCSAVIREWNGFTSRIKREYELECDGNPSIHMRHLWGRTARIDKGKNPFINLSEIQRKDITLQAYTKLDQLFIRHNGLGRIFSNSNADQQLISGKFFNSDRQLEDKDIIYSHFRKNGVAEKFFRLILHSTMSLVASATMVFADECSQIGINGIINYDDSDASKGFDASEVFDVMREYGFAKNITYGSHDQITNRCFLQLADLFSFYAFRRELARSRGDAEMARDPFSQVCIPIHSTFKTTLKLQPKGSLSSQGIALHYLIARRHLARIDSSWVERHLLTAGEVYAATAAAQGVNGVSVIRDSSHAYFMTHGRLP